jgi:ABC-type siderophore export system fused ATPase/permease subunit
VPDSGSYTVTVTGVVGGMLPPKPGDILMNTSPVYGQIFLNYAGQYTCILMSIGLFAKLLSFFSC